MRSGRDGGFGLSLGGGLGDVARVAAGVEGHVSEPLVDALGAIGRELRGQRHHGVPGSAEWELISRHRRRGSGRILAGRDGVELLGFARESARHGSHDGGRDADALHLPPRGPQGGEQRRSLGLALLLGARLAEVEMRGLGLLLLDGGRGRRPRRGVRSSGIGGATGGDGNGRQLYALELGLLMFHDILVHVLEL